MQKLAIWSSNLSGKTLPRMDQNLSSLILKKNIVPDKLEKILLKYMNLASLMSQNCKLRPNYHHSQNWMENCKKITELTTVNSTDSYSVLVLQIQRMLLVHHSIWWPGKTENYCQLMMTMALCMCTIWTVIFKDQSSTSHVLGLKTFRFFQLHRDTLFLFGHRI